MLSENGEFSLKKVNFHRLFTGWCGCSQGNAVFFGGGFYYGEEVSVEASQRLKSAFLRDIQDRFIGVAEQVTGLIYAIAVHVFRKGDACFFLEISG